MLSLLSCAVIMQVPALQPPRLRTLLPNGAAILVERVDDAKLISAQLFIASHGFTETKRNHGIRHLLEHFSARGKGDLDRRLETAGAFLTARTLRDATVYEVRADSKDLKLALDALREVARMPVVSQQDIDGELLILAEEEAMRDSIARDSERLWEAVYGDRGLGPFGSLEAMTSMTPEDLSKAHREQWVGQNLAVTVVGDVDLDAATELAKTVVAMAPKARQVFGELRGEGVSPPLSDSVRAAKVRGFREPSTAWTLAAALALASEIEDGYATYTPTSSNGLMIVGSVTEGTRVGAVIDKASAGQLFARGRALARRWVAERLRTPSDIGFSRGYLLVQSPSLRPEMLLESLETMTVQQFGEGLERFRGRP